MMQIETSYFIVIAGLVLVIFALAISNMRTNEKYKELKKMCDDHIVRINTNLFAVERLSTEVRCLVETFRQQVDINQKAIEKLNVIDEKIGRKKK